MKKHTSVRIALLGALALFKQTTTAQTWQTVDNYSAPSGDVYLDSLAADPFGGIYAVGYAEIDTSYGYTVGLIRKSSDAGATWSIVDQFSNGQTAPGYEYHGITSDSAGTLYAIANNYFEMDDHGIVRRSIDGGMNWSTMTDPATRIDYHQKQSIATDSSGNVYIAGNAYPFWVVRRSSDGGNAWSTLDAFNPGSYGHAHGVFCHPTAGIFAWGDGWFYVTNKSKITQQNAHYIRRSPNGGATWSTIEVSATASTRAMGADASGNIYIAGSNNDHWTVRKSSNSGASWTTVDDFQPCFTIVTSTKPYRTSTQCYSAAAQGFTMDALGNLFVAGFSGSPAGTQWIVRKSAGGTGAWQNSDAISGTARAIAADAFGNVFAGGGGWLVRRASP
jgi:hypothetical protein